MACCGRNKKEVSYVNAPCKVCQENNNDDSIKSVFWCDACGAYICEAHRSDYMARAEAAVRVQAKKVINFIKK